MVDGLTSGFDSLGLSLPQPHPDLRAEGFIILTHQSPMGRSSDLLPRSSPSVQNPDLGTPSAWLWCGSLHKYLWGAS